MVRADVHMMTGAYALDALTDVERRAFERHLAECADCPEEVRGLREAASMLGAAVAVPAPRGMKGRVLELVATTPQVPPRVRGDRHRVWAPVRLLAVAASAAVLVASGLGVYGMQQARRADEARAETARIVAVAADPQAQRLSAQATGGGTATLVSAPSGSVLLADGLAELPDESIYQLWIVRPGQPEAISVGLGPGGESAQEAWARLIDGVRPGDTVALSVEPDGGSRQPTTTPVVALET